MSGVYIKGVKMPERCLDCQFMISRDDDDCILQSDEANASFQSWDDMRSRCPLIPVPDHGRLIDADELTSEMQKALDGEGESWLESPVKMAQRAMRVADLRRIETAPTIIPADREATNETR